jgi:hypothetical protein
MLPWWATRAWDGSAAECCLLCVTAWLPRVHLLGLADLGVGQAGFCLLGFLLLVFRVFRFFKVENRK